MSFLLKIFVAILVIVAVVLIVALFVKKDYSVEREIVINKPKEEVFAYIRHLKNQDHYSKWVMTDPNMKKSFRGTDGTVGFVYAWDGNKQAGKGEQEIISLQEGERMDVEIRFERPFKGIAHAPFTTESVAGSQTKLRWGMRSRMNYPMNIMLLFINMDKMLGPDLDTSLVRLKNILEEGIKGAGNIKF